MVTVDLSQLVNPPKTNSISGRSLGEQFAEETGLAKHILNNDKILILIDDSKVKAINDSFIKGYFSGVFELLKSKTRLKELVELKANNYFISLFDKNWTILEAINEE